MSNYVKHGIHKIVHEINHLQLQFSNRLQHVPHRRTKPAYGQRIQYAPLDKENQVSLPAPVKTLIQRIIGIFLYYAIALDPTMLVALGTLATQQANPTQQFWEDITFF